MCRRVLLISFILILTGITCRECIIENYTLFNPANFLSNFVAYDSDWDVRDASNRQIVSSEAIESLRSLFISNVVVLLNSEIYSIARAMEVLNVQFGFLKSFLSGAAAVFTSEIIAAIINQIKKLIIPVSFVILLISAGILSSLPELAYLFYSPKTKVAPLVLRC